MSRYTVTRSTATVFLALAAAVFCGLLVAVPLTGINPMTAVFAGMVLAGVGMLLRERVLVRVDRV